ncbi:MAG: penicillin-binding protein [Clostridia bacterium]|nr:penicillin-binding protein [Clostridia bacterium]
MRLAREEKKGRYIAIIVIFVCLFAVFGIRLVNIQVINGDKYASKVASASSTSVVKSTRGQILDRNGVVLVGNRQGNDIIFDAASFPEYNDQAKRNEIILSLINLFEKNGEEWIDELPITLDANGNYAYIEDRENDISKLLSRDMLHLNKYATADDCMTQIIERYSLADYSKQETLKIASVCINMKSNVFNTANPYTFAQDVSDSLVSVIKENSSRFPGVDVQITTYREYTDGSIAPHILGVTGAINAEEYAVLKEKGYAMDDIVGKSGIEKVFEENLKGTNGVKTVKTNTDGTQETVVDGLKNGDNIVLTIDSNLQKIAQDSLQKTCDSIGTANAGGGAVVVMNCKTGEILALASYPTYDLSTYYDDYSELVKNTNFPLYNRATLSTYAPGSTAKVSTAIACLEEGIIDPSSTKYCAYNYSYRGHNFVCQIGHDNRTINVKTALQDSCNSFFYYYGGEELGIDKMNMYREMLGLGQPTGIEISENTGVLDSPSYRTSINQTWMPGFSLQSAIGQAGNLFTPLQLCNYVATIANGGTRYEAHLVKSILTSNNAMTVLEKNANVICNTGFKPENIKTVHQGMRLVVTNGSCRNNFGLLDVAVACKTGTSQVEKNINGTSKIYTNGFNISFAPYDDPEIAIAVAVEGARSGSSCAPVACDIYNYYFENIKAQSMTQEENENENETDEENEASLLF